MKSEADIIYNHVVKSCNDNIEKIESKTYTMRIPKTLYEKLEKEAERRKRSINFIVNEKLEKAYKNDNRR